MDDLARFIRTKNGTKYCKQCGTRLSYSAYTGIYTCKGCGYTEKDLYGRMKDLLDENPGLSKTDLSMILDLPLRTINEYIVDGKLTNPQGYID